MVEIILALVGILVGFYAVIFIGMAIVGVVVIAIHMVLVIATTIVKVILWPFIQIGRGVRYLYTH